MQRLVAMLATTTRLGRPVPDRQTLTIDPDASARATTTSTRLAEITRLRIPGVEVARYSDGPVEYLRGVQRLGGRGQGLPGRGRMLASAGGDRSVRMREAESGRELRRLEGHQGWVMSVALSPDGRPMLQPSDPYWPSAR
jgi:WD40 repeat protein